ncbi:hypothetical protein DSM3645_04335, partial [Blastopirellula marina DSM 3645]
TPFFHSAANLAQLAKILVRDDGWQISFDL